MSQTPKLVIKVDLVNNTDVMFTLLTSYSDYHSKKLKQKFYFTAKNWAIYYGNIFCVSKTKVVSLPHICTRQHSKLTFNTDDERREFLLNMSMAFNDWSNSNLFINKKPTKVKHYKSLWLIF